MTGLGGVFDRFATGWLLVWGGLIAVYAHAGGLAFAGLAGLLGAVGWIVWVLRRSDVARPGKAFLVSAGAFAAFFLWLGFTGTFSGYSPETALRLAVLMVFAASVPVFIRTRSDGARDLLANLFMAMALGGVAVILADVMSNYGLSILIDPEGSGHSHPLWRFSEAEMTLGRGHVVWALLTPLILALFFTRLPRRWAWIAATAFLALLVIGSFLNGLAIVPMMLLGTLPLFVIGLKAPVAGLRLALGTGVASILFAPVIGILASRTGEAAMARLPMSWEHRLRMWDYCWQEIQTAPLFGLGLDVSRSIDAEFPARNGFDLAVISLHPHNIGLQTWYEAGLIGAVLLSLALASLYPGLVKLVGSSQERPSWRGAAVTGIVTAAVLGSAATVGAWQYWWWGLIALALAWVHLVPSPSPFVLEPSDD